MPLTLISLGLILIAGLVADVIGRRTALPRVTVLIAFGVAVGDSGLDVLPWRNDEWFPVVADLALLLVGFVLGGKLSLATLRRTGRFVLGVSLGAVAVTLGVVTAGLGALGLPWPAALALGAVSTATDPAATTDVINETGADGEFTRVLQGVVAVDDAWGLIVFGAALSAVEMMASGGFALDNVLDAARELGGGMALGAAIGVPMAYLTGRIRPGEPTFAEAVALVLICGGLSQWLEVSFLLAAMTMGFTVANLGRHHQRPFHAIEHVEWAMMVVFFTLAGAALDVGAVVSLGATGAAYLGLRAIGRVAGGWLGAAVSGAPPSMQRWMGLALFPQAGVAVGMAIIAADRLPAHADLIFSVTLGATIVFELLGPLATRMALARAGELPADRTPESGPPPEDQSSA